MGKVKFSYPPGYGAKFGLSIQPHDVEYPDDLYPEATLEKFRQQGVIITPVVDAPKDTSTATATVEGVASTPAPPPPGAGENNKGSLADDDEEADPASPQKSPDGAGASASASSQSAPKGAKKGGGK